jgi:FkbM family methyltransferase
MPTLSEVLGTATALARETSPDQEARAAFLDLATVFTAIVAADTPLGRLLVRTGDPFIGRTVFVAGRWEDGQCLERVCELVPRLQGRPLGRGVFLDVGANLGTTTLAALLDQGFARAVALEPDPDNLRLLAWNLAGQAARVAIVAAAATDRPGVLTLERSPTNCGDHRVRVGSAAPGVLGEESWPTIAVPGLPLVALLAQGAFAPSDLGLIWIDAQGHEGHILAGARALCQDTRVPVVAEFWPYGLRRAGGLEQFISEAHACFTHFVDLRSDERLEPIGSLDQLAAAYPEPSFTELLLLSRL